MVANSHDGRLLTVKEAAEILHISPRKLWGLTNQREIPTVRIGKSVRYTIEDLREYVDKKRINR
jgi:excisionase family DNA binding protein